MSIGSVSAGSAQPIWVGKKHPIWPANRGKAAFPRHHHIVRSAGAVDDEQFTVCVPAANDAHMGIIRIEHQVTRLGSRPQNIGAIRVLHRGPATMTDNIAAARLIVEHPIDKATAI